MMILISDPLKKGIMKHVVNGGNGGGNTMGKIL
jgi:hypothetical protein